MSSKVIEAIAGAVDKARATGVFKAEEAVPVFMERPAKDKFGDYATNVAMVLASREGLKPRMVAEAIAKEVDRGEYIDRVEVAGPGFINIFMKAAYWSEVLKEVSSRGEWYGNSGAGKGRKVLIEFVSANPTGPLHVGHGRGAAVGDTLANLMEASGFSVTREFYINDAGSQVKNLAESISLKIREDGGERVEWGENHYKGEYIARLAERVKSLGISGQLEIGEDALKEILGWIKKDLRDFNVRFDNWYSERTLFRKGKIEETIGYLKRKGFIEERGGATWFRSTELGDDKDRVVIRDTGEPTYFASDIAYHHGKYQRGFDSLINVWGADHHGYIPRVRAAIEALGHDRESLKVLLVQMVTVLRGGRPVTMSKRAGEFITLREVLEEVGSDATRFFFLMRKSDAHMDFDLDLAKKQAPENPVFYVQYAHARICSIIDHAKGISIDIPGVDRVDLGLLDLKEEAQIIKHIAFFPDAVRGAATALEPHRIVFYLMDLAGAFHPYYNRNRVVSDDLELTKARLFLCSAVKGVLRRGLELIGVSTPEKM